MGHHKQKCNKNGNCSPIGLVEPDYIGQIYVDATNKEVYISNGLTSNDWQDVANSYEGGIGTRFRASLTEFQWVLPNADTQILFNTKDWDTNNEYDVATHMFTVKEEGYYMIMAQAALMTGDACEVGISIFKNDEPYFNTVAKACEATQMGAANIFNTMNLAVGDTIKIKVNHNAPSQKILIGVPMGCMTNFSINKL